MKAMLLAAGYGQRFRPHSLQLAKPALPLFDVPIIAHAIYYLQLMKTKEFIINTHHLPETVKRAIQRLHLSQGVSWSFETSILGSGGGIHNVKGFFKGEEDFFVANSDCVLSSVDSQFLSDFVKVHKENKALVTLLSCPHEKLGVSYGALWCEGDQVKSIGRRCPNPHLTPRHYTGLMILSGRIFEYFSGSLGEPSNIFLNVIYPAIQKGELVQSFHVESLNWYETGNLHSYLEAQKDLLVHMTAGHPHADFVKSIYQFFLDYTVEVGSHLQWISPHSILDGESRVQMGPNVVICSKAQVGRGVFVDNSVVSWGVSLTEATIHSQMVL